MAIQRFHTPGPWHIDRTPCTHITASNGRPIATTGGVSVNSEPDRGNYENKANARLIAAAPEMLDALKTIEKDMHRLPSETCGMIVNAIYKAVGDEVSE